MLSHKKNLLRLLITFLFATWLFSSNLLATNGFRLIGPSPVIRSMGGAAAAMPLDSTVCFVNPAAGAFLEAQFTFGSTIFFPSSTFEADDTPIAPLLGSGGVIPRKHTRLGPAPIPAASVIMPCVLIENLYLSIGITGLGGIGVDYDAQPTGLYNNIMYTNFQFLNFVPGAAYKISDCLSVGVNLNIGYANLGFNVGRDGFGEVSPHPVDSQFAFGWQLGVYFQPFEEISFGISYISKQKYADFKLNTLAGEDKLDFDIPPILVLGIGFSPICNLKIAFDAVWFNWEKTMGKNLPVFSKKVNAIPDYNFSWKNRWAFMVGAEYALLDNFKLRAGYNYSKAPVDKDRAFENIAFPAIVEHHITFGLGYAFTNCTEVNGSFMYAPKASVSGANLAQGIAAYNSTLKEYSAGLSLTRRF